MVDGTTRRHNIMDQHQTQHSSRSALAMKREFDNDLSSFAMPRGEGGEEEEEIIVNAS